MRHELDVGVAAGRERRRVRDLDAVDKLGNTRAVSGAQVLKLLRVEAVRDEILDISPENRFPRSATEPAGEEVVEGDDLGEGEQALVEEWIFF